MALAGSPGTPARLEQLQLLALGQRTPVSAWLGWLGLAALLAWAWQGAEMRPLDLIKYADNMRVYASDFYRQAVTCP